MEVVPYCTCSGFRNGSGVCASCGSSRPDARRASPPLSYFPAMSGGDEGGIDGGDNRIHYFIPRLIVGAISGALTGLFALGNFIIFCTDSLIWLKNSMYSKVRILFTFFFSASFCLKFTCVVTLFHFHD
uniref:Transmembrane protein n=1 Tax=Nelumbo nucifera TaxID=4432 RepID=A0A822YIL7_NELNU|nr:TPA_asm: hypothetical protein HUJ06_010182 [Nelumbo nucifera]